MGKRLSAYAADNANYIAIKIISRYATLSDFSSNIARMLVSKECLNDDSEGCGCMKRTGYGCRGAGPDGFAGEIESRILLTAAVTTSIVLSISSEVVIRPMLNLIHPLAH